MPVVSNEQQWLQMVAPCEKQAHFGVARLFDEKDQTGELEGELMDQDLPCGSSTS